MQPGEFRGRRGEKSRGRLGVCPPAIPRSRGTPICGWRRPAVGCGRDRAAPSSAPAQPPGHCVASRRSQPGGGDWARGSGRGRSCRIFRITAGARMNAMTRIVPPGDGRLLNFAPGGSILRAVGGRGSLSSGSGGISRGRPRCCGRSRARSTTIGRRP